MIIFNIILNCLNIIGLTMFIVIIFTISKSYTKDHVTFADFLNLIIFTLFAITNLLILFEDHNTAKQIMQGELIISLILIIMILLLLLYCYRPHVLHNYAVTNLDFLFLTAIDNKRITNKEAIEKIVEINKQYIPKIKHINKYLKQDISSITRNKLNDAKEKLLTKITTIVAEIIKLENISNEKNAKNLINKINKQL